MSTELQEARTHGVGPLPTEEECESVTAEAGTTVGEHYTAVEDVALRVRRIVAAHYDGGVTPEHVPTRADIGTLYVFAQAVLLEADQLRDRAQEILAVLVLDEIRREGAQR